MEKTGCGVREKGKRGWSEHQFNGRCGVGDWVKDWLQEKTELRKKELNWM